jgi:DNA polymerase III delta prime subunit
LLKLIEEPKENTYFLFTCNLLNNNLETFSSRFFVKKLFLKKNFYKDIINNFTSFNNLEDLSANYDLLDPPGIYLRKYFYNLNPNLENLKQKNEILFYNIISNRITESSNNHLKMLRKLKLNLFLNNDIKKIISKFINE